MAIRVLIFFLSSLLFGEDFSIENKKLSQEVERLYQEWKTEQNITPEKELALHYTLNILGPDLHGTYPLDGKSMLKVKKLLEEALEGSHEKQWYVAQIDSTDDSNYGIAAHTIAVVGLTLDQIENLASFIPALKIDLEQTKNGNNGSV